MIKNLNEEKKYYEVIDLTKEYPGFVGETKWGIVTDLSENDLYINFYDEIKPYIPFVILPIEFLEIRSDYIHNEMKHLMRAIRHNYGYDFDDSTESIHPELGEDNLIPQLEKREIKHLIHKGISSLVKTQQKYLQWYFFEGLTLKEIAERENKPYTNVRRVLKNALKELKDFFLENQFDFEL